jgi:hypothetical protein
MSMIHEANYWTGRLLELERSNKELAALVVELCDVMEAWLDPVGHPQQMEWSDTVGAVIARARSAVGR